MSFDDREYAMRIWTPDKIALLEELWLGQYYPSLNALVPGGNSSVLDVGCGIGMYYELLSKKARQYIGLDPAENMIKRAKVLHRDGDFGDGTVYDIEFSNMWFDLVFCWSVLIHLPHETIEKAIKELWRVTRKRLFFNLYVTVDDEGFTTTGSWGEYITAMDKREVRGIIKALKPNRVRRINYEGTDQLDEKRFQRMIFLLER